MKFIVYLFFRIFVFLFSILPFRLLYLHSDILYCILFHIFKYRKDVVFDNLRKSFPEKSEEEIRAIAKGFYKNLSDITLESIKGFSMSKKTFLKRYRILNSELLDTYFEKGQNLIALAAHYGNWEWAAVSFGFQLKFKCLGLYKPLSNKYIDEYLLKKRSVLGMNLVPIKDTYKTFASNHEKPALFLMASDQSPSNIKRAIWVNFLNRDTACLHGAEKYAKMYNLPLLYFDLERIKRGYYQISISVLEENPQNLPDGEITKLYMQHLERVIRKKPENWLWSHRRWKHKRA